MAIPTWTALPPRQLVTFYNPSDPLNTFTPQINPVTEKRKPNSVRKYMETTNLGAAIIGDREYPPKEITLTWNQMDDSDYQQFKNMSFIYPLVFVDNNDNGFLGALVFDSVEQLSKVTKKIWQVQASFLVTAPYDGLYNAIPKLDPPQLSVTVNSSGGYITFGTNEYFWTTIVTKTGESTIGQMVSATAGSNNNSFLLTFAAPVSIYYVKTRIYWNSAPNPATATFLADIFNSQNSTWTAYGPYVNYSQLNPPSYNSAFTGYWAGALWVADQSGGNSTLPPGSNIYVGQQPY